MRDKTTTARAAVSIAFGQLVKHHNRKHTRFTGYDLADTAVAVLRGRQVKITRALVCDVLAVVVSDGLLLDSTAEALFFKRGDVKLAFEHQLWDAIDEVSVGNLVDAALSGSER